LTPVTQTLVANTIKSTAAITTLAQTIHAILPPDAHTLQLNATITINVQKTAAAPSEDVSTN
jgi:hypothetical protein